MRVRFLHRSGAYFPGADPILDPAEAARLIQMGLCEQFDKPPTPVVAAVAPPAVADEEQAEPEPELPPAPAPSRAPRRR